MDDTERMAQEAGLTDIVLECKADYIEAMTDFQDPLYKKIAEMIPQGSSICDFVTSLNVSARKPQK